MGARVGSIGGSLGKTPISWYSSAAAPSTQISKQLWILNHEGPKSKVVVWAHNAHVARGVGMGVEWMGARLSRVLGRQFVVFGFTFNRGAFLANSGSLLKVFDVPPAPANSLDSVLAASGVELGVVDLRKAPNGVVRDWLLDPRGTRKIGAGFSEVQAMNVVNTRAAIDYDVVIFMDSTTAARPNPGAHVFSRTQAGQSLRNPDFELGLADWEDRNRRSVGFTAGTTRDFSATGDHAAFISRPRGWWPGEFHGEVGQRISVAAYRNRKLRITSAVRADTADSDSGGHVWIRIYRSGNAPPMLVISNEDGNPARGDRWRDVTLETVLPSDANEIMFGIALTGTGRFMIDDVRMDVFD